MSEYGFTEGVDYTPYNFVHPQNAQETTDHAMTLNMAKEISMIQRTERGKQARQHFIAVEAAWNTPEMVMTRALRMADERIRSLSATNARLTVDVQIMAPKAEYFDELVDRNLLTNFRQTAKEFQTKERDFISWLIGKKYIYRDPKGRLMPYAGRSDGLFEVKESMNPKTNWAGTQTLVTPKGRETFRLLYSPKAN